MERESSEEEIGELVDQARTGDKAAWSRLYAIYEQDLRKRVRSRLGPELRSHGDGATEILQSVWGDAIRGLKGFEDRGDGSFLAWVTAILRNKIARRARKARKRLDRVGGSEGHALIHAEPDIGGGPSTEIRRQEDLSKLQAAMSHLDDERREILKLAWFEGLPQREIGERLGISENAARMRISRAEAALTRIFHDLGEKLQ